MPTPQKQAKKLLTFVENPQLALLDTMEETNSELEGINEKLDAITSKEGILIKQTIENKFPEIQKIDIPGISVITLKGDTGAKGDTPSKRDLEALIIPLIPEPIEGAPGKDGYSPIKGVDYFDGQPGINGTPGKDGIDAPVLSAEDIKNQLESLKDEKRLDKSAIKNLQEDLDKLKEMIRSVGLKGAGGGGGGPNANAVQVHYFTGDGTRSYYVPTHRNALLLIGTQGPIMFKRTIDWTTAKNTLTLNAALNDSVGQEYVMLYVK